MATKCRLAVVTGNESEFNAIRAGLESPHGNFAYDLRLVPVLSDPGGYDACIVYLSEKARATEFGSIVHTPLEGLPALFVMPAPTAEERQWAYAHGAAEIAIRPASVTEIGYRLERILGTSRAHLQEATQEARLIELLRNLAGKNLTVIDPTPEPWASGGHMYPDVESVVGSTAAARECLEALASEGLLARTVANRVRLCPSCAGHVINYRETCPKCGSVDILQCEVIHHFACAHVGPLNTFRQGADMLCPKCGVTLRQIGRDYDKPGEHRVCSDCAFIFAEAKIEAQCLRCGFRCAPEETLLDLVYRYRLTPLASEALAEGRIGGISLSSLLRNKHTGLYTRQYLEHELSRELVRATRYGIPFCVLMVRIHDLAQVRLRSPERVADYASSLFSAISNGLRRLDTTCVWNSDTIAVLLPGTAESGGRVVANRMHGNVARLDYLRSIQEPRIAVTMVSDQGKYNTAQEVLDDALQDLA